MKKVIFLVLAFMAITTAFSAQAGYLGALDVTVALKSAWETIGNDPSAIDNLPEDVKLTVTEYGIKLCPDQEKALADVDGWMETVIQRTLKQAALTFSAAETGLVVCDVRMYSVSAPVVEETADAKRVTPPTPKEYYGVAKAIVTFHPTIGSTTRKVEYDQFTDSTYTVEAEALEAAKTGADLAVKNGIALAKRNFNNPPDKQLTWTVEYRSELKTYCYAYLNVTIYPRQNNYPYPQNGPNYPNPGYYNPQTHTYEYDWLSDPQVTGQPYPQYYSGYGSLSYTFLIDAYYSNASDAFAAANQHKKQAVDLAIAKAKQQGYHIVYPCYWIDVTPNVLSSIVQNDGVIKN
ncbi:MAG: hypothetical protein PHW04_01135 [Candidatus Wallbacteria bacterium]|nr:hypothetical protein [Candidatus Wallbacteria bacterium]